MGTEGIYYRNDMKYRYTLCWIFTYDYFWWYLPKLLDPIFFSNVNRMVWEKVVKLCTVVCEVIWLCLVPIPQMIKGHEWVKVVHTHISDTNFRAVWLKLHPNMWTSRLECISVFKSGAAMLTVNLSVRGKVTGAHSACLPHRACTLTIQVRLWN